MKQKAIILFGVMLLSLYSWAQQPALFNFTPTNASGTFYGQAQVNSVATSANDWIAAFDTNGICAGASQIIVNSGIAYINLVIYGDDPTTTSIDEGMTGSEDFTLKLYQASTATYLDYPTSTNVNSFANWVNTNGAPMPSYSNVNDVYDFTTVAMVSLSLNINLCENSNAILLSGGQPTGGVYSGLGVSSGYFNPLTAGVGEHIISYTYNGNIDTSIITVLLPVDASLITTGPFCSNDAMVALNSVTDGGVYSGNGVISNSFDPSAVGPGSYWINYLITDTNNCVQDIPSLIVVNQAPNIPVISQNSTELMCDQNGVNYQWYDANMDQIVGANNQIFSPTSTGGYYVQVNNGNCSEISSSFSYILNRIFQQDPDLDIVILEDRINVTTDVLINKLALFNIHGTILSTLYNSNQIFTKSLAKGLYFLVIEYNNHKILKKIIL